MSSRFAQLARIGARRSLLQDLDRGRISHPTDSHPKTTERLAALGLAIDANLDHALRVQPDDPAFDLIENGEALEADLMEDLEAELAEPAAVAAERAPLDPSAGLRAAALNDPAIAALVSLEDEIRGPDLRPWLRGDQDWTIVADLDVRPHPKPTGFDEIVGAGDLPTGEQWLVVGVASSRTPVTLRVGKGGRMRLIGMSGQSAREEGRTELMFNSGGRMVTIRQVGDWPVDHQIGGLFVVPESDPLVGEDSAFHVRLTKVISELVERDAQRGTSPAGP